jgi:hypothetical protein
MKLRILTVFAFCIFVAFFTSEVTLATIKPDNSQEQNASTYASAKVIRPISPDEIVAVYTEALAWFTGILAISTIGLWIVSWRAGIRQSSDMQASIAKMDEIARSQTKDMRDSIVEAAKAAEAMKDVSGSLKINADKIIESVEMTREMAEHQRRVSVLQTRAYIAVRIGSGTFQERDRNLKFAAIQCSLIRA